ncbi:hypothetical protein EG68_11365 [Paragonimus skrjabini miyazakii]|uniref:Uncharacterized protein n=1 Tax=Paragonimus skrjabini miyazakii TaxID=59628 RepID=A0A8S9YDE6_9TREM|nr:hypothetical protein EG68_11365 [Paragonimus skrjabini miyazakii]
MIMQILDKCFSSVRFHRQPGTRISDQTFNRLLFCASISQSIRPWYFTLSALTQALCKLATYTAVLQEPGQLPEQARRMATEQNSVPDTADRSSAIVDELEC